MGGACGMCGGEGNYVNGFGGTGEKRPLKRPRRRCENNIKRYFEGMRL
jgi:hypothetical protein